MTRVDKVVEWIKDRAKSAKSLRSRRYFSYSDLKQVNVNHAKDVMPQVKKRVRLQETVRPNIDSAGYHKIFKIVDNYEDIN